MTDNYIIKTNTPEMANNKVDVGYLNYVEMVASEGRDETFFNSGSEHAAIVMSRIFKYSKEVKIYCGGFTGEVSKNSLYVSELTNFLLRRGKLTVVAEKDSNYLTNGNNPIYLLLKTVYNIGLNTNIKVYTTTKKVNWPLINKDIHFAVGDKNKIRIETDTTNFTAKVNFNSQKEAIGLIDEFNKLINDTQNTRLLLGSS
jgi:hypothetical protein